MVKVKKQLTVDHVMKTTHFKTPAKAEGALETLKWLEEGAPHKFDGLKGKFKFTMSEFLERYLPDSHYRPFDGDCGTNCCIAGAIYAHMRKVNGSRPRPFTGSNTIEDVFGEIENDPYFGSMSVLPDELEKLFYGYNRHSVTTPEKGAEVLRKYLETGNVPDWKRA